MDLKELESGVDPKVHWYYQNKKRPMLRYVGRQIKRSKTPLSIFDIGSGSGFFAEEIAKKYKDQLKEIILCDIGYTAEEVESTKNDFIRKVSEQPPVIENCIIIMMDLLEHIEHDHDFIADLTSKCQGKNYFFVTVPAFKSLWSSHDVYLGHYRRHTLLSITGLMRKIKVKRSYYIFMYIFPLAWIYRKIFRSGKKDTSEQEATSDMKPVPPFINAIARTVISSEFLLNRYNKLFGLTCVVEGELDR